MIDVFTKYSVAKKPVDKIDCSKCSKDFKEPDECLDI
jgi:hypothetical protein